ncbi:MAG TPA: glycoside hydrolase family 15 protein, partial [Thermoanaerobaculia bacterium]|nr:glycoside hydrolase family 15 protein [Thermoanaerobaculia bacterium]
MSSRIEDYALIGDLLTCALVGRDGSIDWMCAPRFDSPACFAAILGTPENGRFRIAPKGEVTRVERRYRGDTLVLETELETGQGRVRLIDFMPPRTDNLDLVRIVEGVEGTVPMRMELEIRFDYGSIIPWVRAFDGGIHAIGGPDSIWFRADVPLHGEQFTTVSEFEIQAGEQVKFDLTWSSTWGPEPRFHDPLESLAQTEDFWREWASRCSYQGPWREAVVRSFITLKALTYAPTGGIVAAATTSLPELIGGVRNWDYRYCWLRDATFTLYALMHGGYTEEARAWRSWLVNAVAGVPSELQIMYGLGGERRLTEMELDWLAGYEGSRPVRIGNAACSQFQLDVYGELMDALHTTRRAGLEPDENAWRVQRGVLKFLETAWTEPDEGFWEVRGPRRHFTHSKVMAWVAFDRAVCAAESVGGDGPVERWKEIRERIRRDVLEQGYDRELNAFVQYYGSKEPDASLL